MPFEIFKNQKKFGTHTNKIDPEPYFARWEACVPLGSKDQPELIGQPCYKHKSCGHLVKVPHNRIPPTICPWCNVDVVKEVKEIEILQAQGIEVFDAPQQIVNLKRSSFAPLSKIAQYLKGD